MTVGGGGVREEREAGEGRASMKTVVVSMRVANGLPHQLIIMTELCA